MNRKLDFPALLLFVALLFGAIVRFYPAITNGFPLNDGGMFYTMVQDLKANGFALPQFTTYNHANIPFAYPPLGFYVTALLSALLPVSDLLIFLYLPALVNTFSILVFYLFAKETLNSRTLASLAAIFYALSSRSFLWQVMGGGVTRSFGMLFLLLMLWQAVQLFKTNRNKHLLLTILFGSGAVLSHPQTALHAALGGAMTFLFFGLNKRGFVSALAVGLGVALVTSPWWVTLFLTHGFEPLLSAGQTSQRSLKFYIIVLQLHGPGNILGIPHLIFFYTGLWGSFKKRDFFFITWIALAYLVDPRGADGIALLAESMLAGMGLLVLSTWVSRSKDEQAEYVLMKNRSQMLVFGSMFVLLLFATVADFQLLNTSLKADDLAMINWVKSNVDADKTFLLSTGHEFSMSDPLQEWFPTLTDQHSVTTLQGLEWTLADRFFPWYEQLTQFQSCADVNCVDEWTARNSVSYDYLIVMIPTETDDQEFATLLQSLGESVRNSSEYSLVYESERALVFEYKK
ncbi:MAG: glycosyltransferase family 39 protein [Anaerolineales bacterium]